MIFTAWLILKHRDFSCCIAELSEELEELRSEKKQLLASLDYGEDAGLSTLKKDISAIEANLAKLEQQEQKYTAELSTALAEYSELKAQAANFNPDELAMAQLEFRPQKEASAESRLQAVYGKKYDFWTMIGAKRDVAEILAGRNLTLSGKGCGERNIKNGVKSIYNFRQIEPRSVAGKGDIPFLAYLLMF